tara:strand:- start:671 stop:793 length:123 start_codon:yes stop_codon:yes gene_type:complete
MGMENVRVLRRLVEPPVDAGGARTRLVWYAPEVRELADCM